MDVQKSLAEYPSESKSWLKYYAEDKRSFDVLMGIQQV